MFVEKKKKQHKQHHVIIYNSTLIYKIHKYSASLFPWKEYVPAENFQILCLSIFFTTMNVVENLESLLLKGMSTRVFIQGIDGYLPQFCVLLRIIGEAEIHRVFFERSNKCFGPHHDKPLNYK